MLSNNPTAVVSFRVDLWRSNLVVKNLFYRLRSLSGWLVSNFYVTCSELNGRSKMDALPLRTLKASVSIFLTSNRPSLSENGIKNRHADFLLTAVLFGWCKQSTLPLFAEIQRFYALKRRTTKIFCVKMSLKYVQTRLFVIQ